MLGRLEALVRRFIGQHALSFNGLWHIQSQLYDLQADLGQKMDELRAEKRLVRQELRACVENRAPNWKAHAQDCQMRMRLIDERLASLDHVHILARRFGDAFAWVALQGNYRIIQPLTENAPVRRVPTGHAQVGVQIMARALANNGAGFPILHDITDMLRVGDITFVSPHHAPVTVEVKTHYAGRGDDAGSEHYEIQVWGAEENVRQILKSFSSGADESHPNQVDGKPPWRTYRGLGEQLTRIARAQTLQKAVDGDVRDEGRHRDLFMSIEVQDGLAHWDVVQRLARMAEDHGYASETVDDAFIYAAVWTDPPVMYPQSTQLYGPWQEQWQNDLRASEIWYPATDDRANDAWFGTTHFYLTPHAFHHVMPFLLYPLGEDLAIDLLWGRLWFIVMVNLGKIAEDLRERGFEVRWPSKDVDLAGDFLSVYKVVETPDRGPWVFDLRSLRGMGEKMLFEFLPRAIFCDAVEQMFEQGIEEFRKNPPAQPNNEAA